MSSIQVKVRDRTSARMDAKTKAKLLAVCSYAAGAIWLFVFVLVIVPALAPVARAGDGLSVVACAMAIFPPIILLLIGNHFMSRSSK